MSASKETTTNEVVQQLPLERVHVSARNTRQPTEKEVKDSGLVQSLQEQGQLTPGIGRPLAGQPGHVELAAGSRRRVAAGAAGLSEYKVIVRDMDDAEFDLVMLVENFQRQNPEPKAEAEVVQRLVAAGAKTAEQVAARLGKPKSWAERRMRLLKVIPKIFKEWYGGKFDSSTVEMMELIGSLPEATQNGLLGDHHAQRCTSYKELNEHLKNRVLCTLDVNWLEDPDTFVAGCGPGCAQDSSKAADLFDFGTEGGKKKKDCGTCLNPTCFFARRTKALEKQLRELDAGEGLPVVTTEYYPEIVIGKLKASRVDSHELQSETAAKKAGADEKAKKVIVVTRDYKMSIGYLKKQSGGSSSNKKLLSPKEKAKAKIDGLQSRRWKLVHEKLVPALLATEYTTITVEKVYRLAGVYGLPWKRPRAAHEGRGLHWWKHFDAGTYELHEPGTYWRHDKPKVTTNLAEALWSGVKLILKDQICDFYKAGDILGVVPDMERIAELLRFPIAEEKRQADLEILPPKSWGPTDPHTLQALGSTAAVVKAPGGPQKKKGAAKKTVKKAAAKKVAKPVKKAA